MGNIATTAFIVKSITQEELKPEIREFVRSISLEKMKSGDPGTNNTRLIKKLLIRITHILLHRLSPQMKKRMFRLEEIKTIIGNSIPSAFAQVMGVNENFQSENQKMFLVFFIKHLVSMSNPKADMQDPVQMLHQRFRDKSLNMFFTNMIQEFVVRMLERQQVQAARKQPTKLPKSLNPPQQKESHQKTETTKSQERKHGIRLLTRELIKQGLSKSNIVFCDDALRDLEERLVENIWSEVKRQKFEMEEECLNSLSKEVFCDIHERFGCPSDQVLMYMFFENEIIDKTIVSSFRKITKQQEKKTLIRRIISNVGTIFRSISKNIKGK